MKKCVKPGNGHLVLYCEVPWRARIGDVATVVELAFHHSMKHGQQWPGMRGTAGRFTSFEYEKGYRSAIHFHVSKEISRI